MLAEMVALSWHWFLRLVERGKDVRQFPSARDLIDDLMAGEHTGDAARRHGLSPGRVSQLRREFHDDWRRFQDGEPPRSGRGAAAVARVPSQRPVLHARLAADSLQAPIP